MKELSIEEKAKAYDEAYERVAIRFGSNIADEIFPELKEPDDERVRKTLIEYFNAYPKDYYGELKKSHILAWLEKQGEQVEINPSEFDLRLNRLLKQFESLPKEELANSLSFYLNVVQNDGTYKQKPIDEDMKEALRTEYEKGRADAFAEMQKEWSDDDEEMLTEIITDVKFAQERNPQSQMNQIIFEEEINWLKSLKQRIRG